MMRHDLSGAPAPGQPGALSRLRVLVVDDSAWFRNMMAELLRQLGVGAVVSARDGAEAVALLRVTAAHRDGTPEPRDAPWIDLVLSDDIMSPVDGAMLLRWVRQGADCPDRFLPFVMVSAAAEPERIRAARDIGVTEFLAKPVTVGAVADKLAAIIEQPRPFVCSKSYFGPDRRRHRVARPGRERRRAGPVDASLLGSAMPSAGRPVSAFLFRTPNRLRTKIDGLGDGRFALPTELLLAASSRLERMEEDYAVWVRGTTDALAGAHERAVVSDPRARLAQVGEINRMAHDLRGQGSTFGYPLVTVFARSLFDCTRTVVEVGDRLLDFVKAHIDGIGVVVRDRIKGPGGPIGDQLIVSLEQARAKLAQGPM